MHCQLIEMNLRIYVKYSNIYTMIEEKISGEQIDKYIASQNLGQEFFIIQSKIKSLSSIYAKHISDKDFSEKVKFLLEENFKFETLYRNSENTPANSLILKKGLEDFVTSSNKYIKAVSDEISRLT
ncbi:unknown protein [Desulfotalea psychrophila LSv54]|uniref:Uncharacterized protein n=1 Tax=Desulfotalea psychrophila (strain LSv54 / DSM 12343) TaxID=177439 RepID=Q6AI65_DESPS|nr:unknown protein [Desulfotalea psychrophila LSv54]